MVKVEAFEKLKGNNGSPLLVPNLNIIHKWVKSLEADAVLKELSADVSTAGILCLTKEELIQLILQEHPVKSTKKLPKKYTQGLIDKEAINTQVRDSWKRQLDGALISGRRYYLCKDDAIRLNLDKGGSKAVERHQTRVKNWNENHILREKEQKNEYRSQWGTVGGFNYLFFDQIDEDRIENLKVSKYDILWEAIWTNAAVVLEEVRNASDPYEHWIEFFSPSTGKAGTTKVYFQWKLYKEGVNYAGARISKTKMKAFRKVMNVMTLIVDSQKKAVGPRVQLPDSYAAIPSDTHSLEETSKRVCKKMIAAAETLSLSNTEKEMTVIRDLMDVIQKRILGENTGDSVNLIKNKIRNNFSTLPKNKDGLIHPKVTESYFNKLRENIAALERVLKYDREQGGVLWKTTSSEALAEEVMTTALKAKHAESELQDLKKEYFSNTGRLRKEVTHNELQQKLQTCVAYVVSQRLESDAASSPGGKRGRQGRSNQGKLKKQKTQGDGSSAGDGAGRALSAKAYSELSKNEKRKARKKALKKGGFCFKHANGNCDYTDCKFKHDGIPSHLQFKKKQHGGSGSANSGGGGGSGKAASTKEVAKMAAALITKQTKEESQKKKQKDAKRKKRSKKLKKQMGAYLKEHNFSRDEARIVKAFPHFNHSRSESEESESSSSEE